MGWWTAQPEPPRAHNPPDFFPSVQTVRGQFPDAAQELALRVLACLDMDPGAVANLDRLSPLAASPHSPQRILDLGHGNGDSLLLLARLNPAVLDGVTSLAAQAERAQHRTSGRAQVFCADAVDWLQSCEGQAQYDAIIAIDSAYHFSSRRSFFEAAFARLAPGGKLLLFDLFAAHPYPARGTPFFTSSGLPAPSRPSLIRRCKHALTLRLANVPSANLLPFGAYASELRRAGFNARIADVSDHVFPGFSHFLLSLGRGTEKYWRGGTRLELLSLRMFGEVVETWASGGAEGSVRSGLVCAAKPKLDTSAASPAANAISSHWRLNRPQQ